MLCQHNFQSLGKSLGKVQYFEPTIYHVFFLSSTVNLSIYVRLSLHTNWPMNIWILLSCTNISSRAGLHFFQNSTASKKSLNVSENYNTGICVFSFMFKLLKHGSIVMVILDTPTKVLMSFFFLVATFVMNMNNQSSRIPLLNY